MITAGLKLTQSGGIALLNEDRLEFNIEMQKLDNNRRYSDFDDLDMLPALLGEYGYKVADVDHWVIDGWDGSASAHALARINGVPVDVRVAPYRETHLVPDPCQPGHVGKIELGGSPVDYSSYVHVASHMSVAYSTSPFARHGEPSMVMVWDGGCFPRLYCVDADGRVEPGGEVFPLIGHTYSMASQYYGPFRRRDKSKTVDDLAVAGKMMAYIALGNADSKVKDILRELFYRHFEADTPSVRKYRDTIIGCGSTGEPSHSFVHAYLAEVNERTAQAGVSDEDVLASVHEFLEELLVERVAAKIQSWKGDEPWNLCFAGGCALNIKWNSALRSHPMIRAMWVPPFPDDSGSAIGTACAHLGSQGGLMAIDWGVRLGPSLRNTAEVPHGWTVTRCTPAELAGIIHRTGRPVVVLQGAAELGPRALGARSILAPAVDPRMKDRLNEVKHREHYRPVAPVCLVEHAPELFDPGTPDPYMLFEHRMRPEWASRIPAIVHLDGTARLQTVSESDDPCLTAILREYYRLSGIPVLCNTSANLRGSGFFPDVASAAEWGGLDRIWSDGMLYRRALGPVSP
jgi:carbamoyltransferase